MGIVGNSVVRREDPVLLTAGGTYVGDLELDNCVHVVYVRSIVGHGRITEIEVDEARAASGVVGVFTAEDLADLGMTPHMVPGFPEPMRRPFLASDVVRYVGQPIVAVVAESVAEAVDASELVLVGYEPLDAVVDLEAAVRDEVVLFPDVGTNVVSTVKSDREADFSGCEVVVQERIMNQRLTAAPMEARAGAAWWTDDQRLVHYSSCQGAHSARDLLADVYSMDQDQVRVVVPDVGGGFGAKSRVYPDELALGWYARALGRPVKWVETRTENIMSMPQGRGQLQYAKLGGTRDGVITAYQLDVIQDAGAYPIVGAILANMAKRMLTGTYEIRNVGFTGTAVVTNMASTTAYRGAGRPEATVAIERMIDRFAVEIGMDPAEVRRKNLVPKFTEPYTTGIGTVYDVGNYPEALRIALEASDYEAVRSEQAERRSRGDSRLLGVGIGCYVEITAGSGLPEFGSVKLGADGRMEVICGATPYGQGHATTWAMIVADLTGFDIDKIDVVAGDTDKVQRGGLTVGSRSVQVGGAAVAGAARQFVDSARVRAASLLEAASEDVVLDLNAGCFHVSGTPSVTVSWAELADGFESPLYEFDDFTPDMPTFPSGAHVAVVEVDIETGATELVRMIAVDDAGRLINPLLAEGQIHGGLAQGIAQVLLESIEYDEYGSLVTSNFMDYQVISAVELPSFELEKLETPTWVNELGAKGVGESGTVGAIPSVYNAVLDAVSHLGIHHLETPISPEKLWRAIQSRRQAE